MLERPRRAIRLGYLVGRAVVHTVLTRTRIGMYCLECNSVMVVDDRTGEVTVRAGSGSGCPVHLAWREMYRITLPTARTVK